MAELPLAQGIGRFKQNEDRMDRFTNGTDGQSIIHSDGQSSPSIRKFLKDKDTQINQGAESILTAARNARDAALGAKDDSEDARDLSIAARTDSIDAKDASETARDDAVAAGELAEKWANNPEDVPVQVGQYSAYHWAKKAEEATEGVDVDIINERIDVKGSKRFSVLDYGADPTGATMSTSAFQACMAAAIAGNGDFVIPEGIYKTDAPTVCDLTSKGFNDVGRINIIGAGKGRTEWRYYGSPSTAALSIIGAAWANGSYSRQTVKGFRLRGMDPLPATGRLGILVTRSIDMHWEDVECIEFYYGAFLVDVVHLLLDDCGFSFNNFGFNTGRSPSYGINNDGSPGNIFVFNKCGFIANRQFGAAFQDSANIVFVGGSFEGNGRTGAWTSDAVRWGVRILDGGYNGAANLLLYGTHFETSGGTADVIIDHSTHPGVYTIDGCDFCRNGTDQFPTNNILFNTTGATKSTLRVKAGFRGVNGYVPNASRRYVAHAGTLGLHEFDDNGSVYESSTEIPTFAGRRHWYASHAHGWALFGPTGTQFAGENIASIVRNSAGNYTITWQQAARSVNYTVAPSVPGGPQIVGIVSRTATSVRIQVYNLSGAAVDPTGEVGLIAFA